MKKLLQRCLLLTLLAFAILVPKGTYAQKNCDPCESVPWSPEIVHQFYFTPMSFPSCVVFGEITYRTKYCNGLLMYEITNEELTVVQGSCNFAVCIYGELHKDIEKEMILNVLGTTHVIASKPSSCYKLLEMDASNDAFKDCWTHHGALDPKDLPMLFFPCSSFCCLAEATVKYDALNRPIIFWKPLTDKPECDDKIPVPSTLPYKVCCETTIGAGGEEICTNYKTFNLKVLKVGPCTSRCDASMFFKQGTATSIAEAEQVIKDNINFLQGTKIFPNPSDRNFNVKLTLPSDQKVAIEIMDMKGQLIKSMNISYETGRTDYALETAEMPAGVYLCRITTADYGDKIIKITKQ